MPSSNFFLTKICVVFLFLFEITSNSALCAPEALDLESSADPLLIEARKYDIAYQPPEKVNQKKAEELYLKYVAKNPDSSLVPYIFWNLGHLYSSRIPPEYQKKYSLIRDNDKAVGFFAECVKYHPKDKISNLLVNAKICVAAEAPTKDEKIKQYTEYYEWLASLKKEEIGDKLWLSDYEKKLVQRRPGWKERLVKNFWNNRSQVMDVAAQNMVATARSGEHKGVEKRLNTIIEKLPDQQPAQLAQGARDEWLKAHPSMDRKMKIFQRTMIWGNLALLTIIVIAIILRRKRMQKGS